jgi:16S rRNA (guanine(966)-N(2))-methyltransferase RsmD
MRVVGGSARGRKLLVVPGDGTRPILDRVKTALFDILRPRIPDMAVLDLFAGSGSVGIEALSQGAAHCSFIDLGQPAVATIRKNLATTGFADRAEVRQADAFAYLAGTERSFDLIYVAPPQYRDLWIEAMRRIAARPELLRGPSAGTGEESDSGLVIVQIDPKEYQALDLGELCEVRQKRYGNTLLLFFERPGLSVPGPDLDPGMPADDPDRADEAEEEYRPL